MDAAALGAPIGGAESVEVVDAARCWHAAGRPVVRRVDAMVHVRRLRAGSARLDIAHRHRLARGRAAAVAGVPARRARRDARRATSSSARPPADAPEHRGTRRSSRCAPTASSTSPSRLRRRRAQRRPLRPRPVRRRRARVAARAPPGTPIPTPTTGRHRVTISVLPARRRACTTCCRGRGAQHAAAGRAARLGRRSRPRRS